MWWQLFLPLSETCCDFIWSTLSSKGQLQSEGRETALYFGFVWGYTCSLLQIGLRENVSIDSKHLRWWLLGKRRHFPRISLKRIKLAHLLTLKSAYSLHLFEAEAATVSLLLCRYFLPASTVSKSSQASGVCSIEISAPVPTTAGFIWLPAPTDLSAADWWSPLFLAISCCPLLDCVTYWQSNLFQSDLL